MYPAEYVSRRSRSAQAKPTPRKRRPWEYTDAEQYQKIVQLKRKFDRPADIASWIFLALAVVVIACGFIPR